MWIDTHCHLDAREFGAEADAIAARAAQQGVRWIVIPAVARDARARNHNFLYLRFDGLGGSWGGCGGLSRGLIHRSPGGLRSFRLRQSQRRRIRANSTIR